MKPFIGLPHPLIRAYATIAAHDTRPIARTRQAAFVAKL